MTRAEHRLFALLASLALSLTVCASYAQTGSAPKSQSRINIAGSALLEPMISDMARRFETRRTGVHIEVRTDRSGNAIKALRAGAVDIAMASRPLLQTETDLFAFHVARDGVAVVVHRDNAVKGLDRQQLIDLLTGRIRDWKALGGKPGEVSLAWRSDGQGAVEFLLATLKLRREQIGPHVRVVDNRDALSAVSKRPNAVALVSVGEAERAASGGASIKLLAYNDVPASTRNVQNRSYAISRPLTLLTRELPSGVRKDFIDFALSGEVTDLQLKYGFVPYQE
jgi:phosphate transport system substrate-binding protein